MQGDEKINYIECKKKKNNDDDAPISKKALRRQKKEQSKNEVSNKLLEEHENSRKQESRKKQENLAESQAKQSKGQLRMIEDIKDILPNHRQETIRSTLQKYKYNKALALDQLMNIPEDCTSNSLMAEFEQPSNQKQPNNKQSQEEQGNNFIYEIMDSEDLQMNPSQFEQLFQQIASIIKEDQKKQGMGVIQINEFVDNFFSVKNMLLDGEEELYIDEDDPLLKQTEQFLYEIIIKKVAVEEKRRKQFPTLGDIEGDNSSNAKNLIQQIQQGYRELKNKEEYFTPSKVPQINKSISNHENSIYSIKNDYNSHADILQLSKEYNGMSIDMLKFVYFRLHDINLCKSFLNKYYPDKKYRIKIEERKKIETNGSLKKGPDKGSSFNQSERRRMENEDYKNYSLEELRAELDHLFKLKNLFKMTRGKITNQAYRKQLQRLSCRQDPTIRKLRQAAKYKLIKEMAESHPQYIDLHGYREEEIDDIFDEIREMLISEFRKGNSLIQSRRIDNKVYCVVRALTGKGLHSRSGRSILKPAVKHWSEQNGFKSVETEDSIEIFIQIA